MEEVLKILHWAPLILWTNDQGRCSERQICPFKKINYLCSCIEHLLPLHLWTQQRRCLKSKHLLPYIYEHNRGGASSQSCTDTEAKNITIHRQSWTPPPLVWIYIHNRGAWIFLLDRFAFLSTSSGQLCSQNQRCSTKNLKQRWLRFFVEHLFCVHKCKRRRCSMQNLEHLLHFLKMWTWSNETEIFQSSRVHKLTRIIRGRDYSSNYSTLEKYNPCPRSQFVI